MATILIQIVALFFAGMGLYGLAMPARLVAPLGLTARSADARAEVRAVYGGFGLAIAVVLALASVDAYGLQSAAAITVAAALGGMACGRVVSALVERPSAFFPVWFYFVVELALAGLLVAAVAVG